MSVLLQRFVVGGSKSLHVTYSQSQRHMIMNSLFRCHFIKNICPLRTKPNSFRTVNTSQRTMRNTKLAFDREKPIMEDILIYSYRNDRFYRLMTIFGIGQFVFWIQLAYFSKTSMADLVKISGEHGGEEPWWMKYTIGGNQHKNAISLLAVCFGTLVLAFCWVYPQRSISSLTLMRGGNGARISVYSVFGRRTTFSVPLDDVNAMQGRAHQSTNMSLKIKGRRFYYMLDKRDGKFHEPELFDHRVALKRW